jgi:hypothetical protein
MTFDELWRMNLTDDRKQLDLTIGREQLSKGTTEEEIRDELELSAEDRAFLWQVGIKP